MSARRDKLHAAVSSALEDRILGGELKVGDKLNSESAIADEFGVSTRSVREAIQTLETKGLVQRRHGGRTTVVRQDVSEYIGTLAVTVRQQLATDPDYLEQLMQARRMIETETIGLLMARRPIVAPRLRQNWRRCAAPGMRAISLPSCAPMRAFTSPWFIRRAIGSSRSCTTTLPSSLKI